MLFIVVRSMPASLTSPFHVKMVRLLLGVQLAIGLWSNNGYNSTSRLMYGREVVNQGVGRVIRMVGDAPPCVPLSRTRLCGPHWHLRYTVAAACKSVGKSSRETYCRYFCAHLRRWVFFMMGHPSDLVLVSGCSVIALRSYGHGHLHSK